MTNKQGMSAGLLTHVMGFQSANLHELKELVRHIARRGLPKSEALRCREIANYWIEQAITTADHLSDNFRQIDEKWRCATDAELEAVNPS